MQTDPLRHILDRLDGVRRTGPDRWIARCPAHADQNPSLSIREGDDGRVLIYCFTGCGAIEILDALGLDFADLFPPKLDTYPIKRGRPRRSAPPIPARDALEILDQETLTMAIIGDRLVKGEPIEKYQAALRDAAGRIAAIRAAWMEAPR